MPPPPAADTSYPQKKWLQESYLLPQDDLKKQVKLQTET